MFKQETVFILGAGASWHYGYPTGEQLVRQVIAQAISARDFFSQSAESGDSDHLMPKYWQDTLKEPLGTSQNYRQAADECSRRASQLENINPLVIDYFLAQHCGLRMIGKLMIALVLLNCEAEYRREKFNFNRSGRPSGEEDDWYRFLVHRLTVGCSSSADLCANKVTFVTFNYDVSLETRLLSNLSSIQMFDDRRSVEKFFGTHRILHIYGKLRHVSPVTPGAGDFILRDPWGANQRSEIERALDDAYEASKDLRTIDPDDKGADETTLRLATAAIERATHVYILGYGFDAANSRRPGLDTQLYHDITKRDKRVMFTNLGDSNRVNKEASMLFFRNRRAIYSGSPLVSAFEGGLIFIERSIKDVYSAFSSDFDAPEQLSTAGS